MSEHEDMARMWTMTLMTVLNGYTLTVSTMVRGGEERKIVEMSMEAMEVMMQSHTLEQKQLLAKQLDVLCMLANES